MNKKNVLLICAIVIAVCSLHCGKKSETEIIDQEVNKASTVGINKQIDQLKQELSKAPNDYQRAVSANKIAELYDLKGNTAAMYEYSQQAVKFQPNLYMSRYLLGKSYNQLGRYREAQQELEASIQLKSDFALAYFELGNAYYKQYNYQQAIEAYKKAIQLDPKLFMAHNNVALLYIETHNYQLAEQSLKKAIEVKPDFAVAYKNLGILYETKLRNTSAAIEYYSKYIALRPTASDRKAIESWIKMLGGTL